MPKKYMKKGKRNIKRKGRQFKRFRPLLPKVYYFTRSQVFDINLGTLFDVTPQAGFFNYSGTHPSPACVAQYRFKLSDVVDWTEFSNLFMSYKIPAVSVKMYPSCGIGGGSTRENSQCIVYTMPSPWVYGAIATETEEEDFLTSQCCKKRLLLNNQTAEPLSFYMKTKQSVDIDLSSGKQAMIRPRWIPFTGPNNPQNTYHYGITQRIQPINNSSLPNVSMKIVIKYYIMCKQVR